MSQIDPALRQTHPGDLLNETEAAAFLGVKRPTMANWRWKKTGPIWVKIGSKLVRYRRADLLSFVEAGGERVAS